MNSRPAAAGNSRRRRFSTAKWIGIAVLGFMAGTHGVGPVQTWVGHSEAIANAAREAVAVKQASLSFGFAEEPPTGGAPPEFVMRGTRYALRVTPTEAMLALPVRGAADDPSAMPTPADRTLLRLILRNADPYASAMALEELPGKVHDFVGARWRRNVPTYARVKFVDVYQGIDVVYHDSRGRLEYDFIVSPGADAARIALVFASAEKVELDVRGNLRLHVDGALVVQERPRIYQDIDGVRRQVDGGYVLNHDGSCSFQVSSYDKAHSLVIDPVVSYASYLGGSNLESPFGDVIGAETVVGPDGSLYVSGFTHSVDFPTATPIQPALNEGYDAFVAKVDPTGSILQFSTYFGGSGFEAARAIALGGDGRIHIAGFTNSSDFPVTPGVVQPTHRGVMDAFAATLDPTGTAVVFSTYLGGSAFDVAFGVGVDTAGNTYIAGRTFSDDFPIVNALQPAKARAGQLDVDAFVAKLNPTGRVLIYSSYLGGGRDDAVFGLAVDPPGNLYLVGRTFSADFPTTPGAFDGICGVADACVERADAFVAKVPPSGSPLLYSTYLGGSQHDWGFAIDIDASGSAYVTGYTESGDLPVSAHAAQPALRGPSDAFVSKIAPTGATLVYTTYLGGDNRENIHIAINLLSFQGVGGIAVDPDGNACVTGLTYSSDFPLMNPFQPKPGGLGDTFVTMLDPMGSSFSFSSYFGGSADDLGTGIGMGSDGSLYVVGATASTDFPITQSVQSEYGGGPFDVFLAKLSFPVVVRTVLEGNAFARGSDLPLTVRVDNRTSQTKSLVLAVFLQIPSLGETIIFGPQIIGVPPTSVLRFSPHIDLPVAAPPGLWNVWAVIAQQGDGGPSVVDAYGRGFVVE